jgi:hypothetical protein
MKMNRVLDASGDTVIEFDETAATALQLAEARAIFDKFMGKGAAFLTNRPNKQPDLKITQFGQIEDGAETILVKQITAG